MTPLSPVQQKFILHWGEMGTRWGINRTVAQIHALLFISQKPLDAEDIVQALGVEVAMLSNFPTRTEAGAYWELVQTNLKVLLDWHAQKKNK